MIGEFRKFFRRVAVSLCFFSSFLLVALLGSCSILSPGDGARGERIFSRAELSEPYDQITLKTSLTIDALPKIQRFQSDRGPLLGGAEVLSEGRNTVATVGQSKDGRRTWFNMVVFHEFQLNVIRKYFFIVDERPSRLGVRSSRGMTFDCEIVVEKEVLDRLYTSENVRRIAILKHASAKLREDIEALGIGTDSPSQENKMLSVCGMLINQTLELVLLKLDSSPVLATKLGSVSGIDFDHINFGKGKVGMVVENDMAAVAFRFGAFVGDMEGPK